MSSLTGLTSSTLYNVRAYATNSVGTSYGSNSTFTTLTTPTVTTTAASNVGSTTATTGGNVTSDGGAAVSARGVAYATTSNPTTANSTTSDGTGTGSFVSSLTGLTSSTLYNVRAYATNSVGTSYGSNVTFTTTVPSPEIVVTSTSFTSDFGTVLTGANSATSSYSVSGSNLSADITITPPTGFQIRTGSNAFSSSAVVLSPSGGTVSPTTIDVRFSPSTEGAFSANITHTSTGATTQNLAVSGRNPISYIWNQTGTASAATSTNWTPTRSTTHATDRLIINNGAANTLTGLSTASIRSLMVSNSSTVTLQGSADATISISDSLLVGASSTLILDGSSSADLVLNMGASSSKAEIAGTMAFYGGGAHKLTSTLANGIEFLNGATFVAENFSGNPFGATTAGSVVFRNGSTYVFRGGSNPFGAAAGSPSITVFESTSNFVCKATSPSFSGRTYAGIFTYDTTLTANPTGSSKLTMNTLVVNSGILNLNLTGGIDISGSITSNGTLTFTPLSASTVTLNGASQSISGSGTISLGPNATLANNSSSVVTQNIDLSLSGPMTTAASSSHSVSAGKKLSVASTLTNNGAITLKAASESSYAQLLPSGTVSGSGTVTMEKSVTGSTAGWRFVSAPVTGGTLANFGSNVLINSSPPNNIITLNTANPNAWVGFNSLGQNTSSSIGAGKGYALYYGGASGVNGANVVTSTRSLTGSLSTSDVIVSGLSAGASSDNTYGWSLVGNPFTCGISLSGLTRSNVAEAYYIWDVNKSGGAGFASYVGTTSTPSGALNGVIPPMQGFLVKATAASPSLTIPTSARTVATPNAQLRGTSSFTHRMYLRISEPQSGKWDETALLSDPQATALFEGSFDAYKLNSWDANALNLATMSSDNQRLSINTTGDWDASLQVPLQLTTTLNGPMQLTANVSEVAAGQPLWLEDLHTGAYHDLRAGAYSFTHLSNVADRFRIHFRALSTSVKPEPLAGVLVYAYEGRLYVQGLEGACRLEVVDVRGRLVASMELESGAGSGGWLPAVAPGIYGVRCRTEQGMKVVKVQF